MKTSSFSLPLIALCLIATPAAAQSDSAAMERMDRIERDVQLVQRQIARGDKSSGDSGGAPIANAAQLEVRLSGIEDQLRELRGSIEQNQNEVRKVTEALDRFQKDTEFRLTQTPAAPVAAAPSAATTQNLAAAAPAAEAGEKKPTLKSNFATPRDHYNYAFRLLNQTQYEQAATSFDDFTKKHPKDPLVGNAYYWGGETYYIRRDYVQAADYFRLGYEAMPEGPKAADNLYKLALSLNQLDRQKEACVVLQQVASKFKKTSTNISAKAEQEIKNSGCRSAQ